MESKAPMNYFRKPLGVMQENQNQLIGCQQLLWANARQTLGIIPLQTLLILKYHHEVSPF